MKYSIKKPGTKNVFMILVSILLVGGAFGFAEYRNRQAETLYTKPNISVGVGEEVTSNQSENDTDWKRVLLASDTTATGTVKDLTKKTAPLSPSDLLARDFFARYMELQQTGNVNDPASQEELIAHVLQNGSIVATPKVYSYTDIKTKNDNTDVALKNYYNELGAIIKKYSIQYRNEAIITKEAFDKADMNILKELDPIIKNNRAELLAFINVVVPSDITKNHLDLINTLSAIVYMDEGFKNSATDPFAGIQATGLVLKNNDNLILVLRNMKNTIISRSIIFEPSEAGSVFTKIQNI